MSGKTFVLNIVCYIYYLLLLFIVVVGLVLSYLDKRGRCRGKPAHFGGGLGWGECLWINSGAQKLRAPSCFPVSVHRGNSGCVSVLFTLKL